MRKLSSTTIKSYNSVKLAKHLDKLMNKFDVAPYRVDLSFDSIYELDKSDNSYHHVCSINDYNKDDVVNCINNAWRQLEKGQN